MGLSTTLIHDLVGLQASKTDPGQLRTQARTFNTVAATAASVGTGTANVVQSVLAMNQGAATEAYTDVMKQSTDQLSYLGDKATATATAHEAAADCVEAAQVAADTLCAAAARQLVMNQALPPLLREVRRVQILRAVRQDLIAGYASAASTVDGCYSGLLPIDVLTLSEGQRRGSVPPGIEDAYANLTPEERMQFLRNVAEEVYGDWPEADQPEVIFYSHEDPLPPGAVRPPDGADWSGYNGVRVGDKVYLNYDIGIADPDPNDPYAQPTKPTLLSTTVHEVQHVEQGRLRDEYDALSPQEIEAIKAGQMEDPFIDRGSTIDEVERFRLDYRPADDPRYTHQPVEIDARRAGTEYLDGKTPEELEELMP